MVDDPAAMNHTTPRNMPETTPHPATPAAGMEATTDAIGVSADELIELIRSGQGSDVSQLVRDTLEERRAA